MSFENDILGGKAALIRSAIKSPNYVAGSAGWSINKDGSAEFNNGTFRGTVAAGTFAGTDFIINVNGMFFYSGTPGGGNLIASIVPGSAAVTDPFGTTVQPGILIGQGSTGQISLQPNIGQAFDLTNSLAGVFTAMAQYFTGDPNQMMPSMIGSVLLGSGPATTMSSVWHSPFGPEGACVLLSAQSDGPGTPVPPFITFGTVAMPDGVTMIFTPIMALTPYAAVFYSAASQQFSQTFTASGTWTAPAGVTSAKVEAWGGGAGGQYSSGPGGGGGEYAAELANTVTPGNVYTVTVGAGGAAGTFAGGGPGGAGGNSSFSGTGATTVTAHGAGTNNTSPSPKGTGSTNTTHFNGGSCTDPGGPNIGGGGGGGSGGTASAGNSGSAHSGLSGGAGAIAVAGGGAGGAGGPAGNTQPPGGNGSVPGGGGGAGGSVASGGNNGGSGARGQVRITWNTGSPTVGMSVNFGSATADQYGNAIPAGIKTTVGISRDTWHTVTLDAGWTNQATLRYKFLAEQNAVWLIGNITHAAITAGTNINGSNPLPAAYRPAGTVTVASPLYPGRCGAEITSAGVIIAEPLGSSITECDVNGIYPLD